ncbi:hypothetical protein ACJPQX_02950 [Vibrio vulnificus]|uniref:hypothetical protein n=1 Tax=Vibrio TaxID=662 RepID=UPI000500624C|nr:MULTISPECIES: hypothetical protein [Vibrio]EJB8414082.1 hypothetical protein [Vibrio vulnificus]ELM6649445.1 hypothetical protein [Vibrio vulnificus]KFK53252.1 phage-like protein [Vibrio vulnificus]
MKNQLTDLNDHLFAQIERLGDESLKGPELEMEVARSKAITAVSQQIVNNAQLVLEGAKFKAEYAGKYKVPMMEDKRHA